jgi:hypothetical protein
MNMDSRSNKLSDYYFILGVILLFLWLLFEVDNPMNEEVNNEEEVTRYMPELVIPNIPKDNLGLEIINGIKRVHAIETKVMNSSKKLSKTLKNLRNANISKIDEFESDNDYESRVKEHLSEINFLEVRNNLQQKLIKELGVELSNRYTDNNASISFGEYDANKKNWPILSISSKYITANYIDNLGYISISNNNARDLYKNPNKYIKSVTLSIDSDRKVRLSSVSIKDKVSGRDYVSAHNKVWQFTGGRYGWEDDISFSPDGRWINSGGSTFDTYRGERIYRDYKDSYNSTDSTGNFSPGSQYVAIPGRACKKNILTHSCKCWVEIFSLGSGLSDIIDREPVDRCWEVSYSLDGGLIASTSAPSGERNRGYSIAVIDRDSSVTLTAASIFKSNPRLISNTTYFRGTDGYIKRKKCCQVDQQYLRVEPNFYYGKSDDSFWDSEGNFRPVWDPSEPPWEQY